MHGCCSRSTSSNFSPPLNDSLMSWPVTRLRSFVFEIVLEPRAVGELVVMSTTIIGAPLYTMQAPFLSCEASSMGRGSYPPRRALAPGAQMRAALADDDAADRRAAAAARQARASVDAELVLIAAGPALGRAIERVEARALAQDRPLQRRAD